MIQSRCNVNRHPQRKIVILDLTIPGGMGGKQALERLLKIDPHARAIVSSGYATDPVTMKYVNYGFSAGGYTGIGGYGEEGLGGRGVRY